MMIFFEILPKVGFSLSEVSNIPTTQCINQLYQFLVVFCWSLLEIQIAFPTLSNTFQHFSNKLFIIYYYFSIFYTCWSCWTLKMPIF